MARGKEPMQGGWNKVISGPDEKGDYTAINVGDPSIAMKVGSQIAAEIQESSFQLKGRGRHDRDRVAVTSTNGSSPDQEISISYARTIFGRPSKKSSK